ncbi:hydroxyacylglutathione hydrolase [Litorivivens lipolytica]|uniref:Hydroxyacylglutathione hydrolase n=1 Tax=Litorivivens lipolytica TaxID=1524264 RepID=A0A7W4W352_9GAMM|nr:hydroxyacylglutathione hydrolase [Litorivivens lipolytica]MBB3046455.1 hydroxyacylglutathione hydrolase [Litorivivens lipolytica]
MITIEPISAFSDNYIWCLSDSQGQAWVVDPGEAAPVEQHLRARDLSLQGILITHHHFDHVGALPELVKSHSDLRIVGPASSAPEINEAVKDGDRVELLALEFEVLAVPGHTLDHIAFYTAQTDQPSLFCGDTLFAGGCGRLFEGTPEQMHHSLGRLKALPGETRVYCAHEYTQANLAFAHAVEPQNTQLAERIRQVEDLRSQNQPTVPSSLAEERATNPFLRADQAAVQVSAKEYANIHIDREEDIFAAIRRWKDNF